MVVAIDENGEKLYNNNLIRDLLLRVLFAGHSTPAIAAFWALLHISQNPHVFQKAKVRLLYIFIPILSIKGLINSKMFNKMS